MTTDYERPTDSGWGVNLPILILTLAFSVFLATQIAATRSNGENMKFQLSNFDKQIQNVKDAEKQMDEINQKSEEPVKQANQLQERFSALLNDVYDLAKDDEDARKVIQKYGIQRNKPEETKGEEKEKK